MSLHSEFDHACRHHRNLAFSAAAAFLPPVPDWGIAHVAFERHTYQPSPDGPPAIVVADWGPMTIEDLVACRTEAPRTMASRLGLSTALGRDYVGAALEQDRPVRLVADTIHWIANHGLAVVILDWPSLPDVLRQVDRVVCSTPQLARRVHAGTRCMDRPPRISLHQPRTRHAA